MLALKLLGACAYKRKQAVSSFQSKYMQELQKVHEGLISKKPSSFNGIRVLENLVDNITQTLQ